MTKSHKKKFHVYVTDVLVGEAITMLKKHFAVTVNKSGRHPTKARLKKIVATYDGVLSLLNDRIDAEVIKAAGPRLQIIANYAVGYDNIDIKAATKAGIVVTNVNTPGVLDGAVADHAFALMLAVARRIIPADVFTREGMYQSWEPDLFIGQDVSDKIIGIVGFGQIGKNMAQRARGFNMRVCYHDVKRLPAITETRLKLEYKPLNALLTQADFVSLHVPLLPATKHLISTKQFAMMKPSAVLVNTSRGPVVDEKALVRALKQKQVAGAGLDVYEFEPAINAELRRMPNVVLTPHIASATYEARNNMGMVAATALIDMLIRNKQPVTTIKPR